MEYSPDEIREVIEHVSRLRADSRRLRDKAKRICRLIGDCSKPDFDGQCEGRQPKELRRAILTDITEDKKAEQERSELSGRLIHAQEQERRRLAMDLHDDIGQRLVILAIELDSVARKTRGKRESSEIAHSITVLHEVMKDLHSFSHRLHSSRLDVLGLVASIRSLCADFEKQQAIRINYYNRDVPEDLNHDMALALFRIAQEGMQNISKHSGASEVEVRLEGKTDEIMMTISDNGTGFDLKKSSSSTGLGIHSMRERALFLQGTFEMQSQPPVRGTRIVVTLPNKSTSTAA